MSLSDSKHVYDISIDDLDEVNRLHQQYLNYGEGIRPHFEKVLSDDSTVALKYVDNDIIAGILIYINGIDFVIPDKEIKTKIEEKVKGKKVYTGDAVLVINEYRRRNISIIMNEIAKERMKELGVSYVVHELWVYPNGKIPAIKDLGVYGESYMIGHYEGFYKNYHKYGYICPVCGNDCKCSAEIYVSELL